MVQIEERDDEQCKAMIDCQYYYEAIVVYHAYHYRLPLEYFSSFAARPGLLWLNVHFIEELNHH